MTKINFYKTIVIVLGLILLTGCGFGNSRQSESNNSERIISSDDGLFSITIPKGWVHLTDYSLHDEAEIQAEKQFKSQYLVALIENKEDLDFTFEEWKMQVIDDYLENMDKSSISEGKDLIIDGQPAIQYEIKGVIDRVNIAILATYIDGESHYAQILAWTLPSKFKSSVEEFSAIVSTIKGL